MTYTPQSPIAGPSQGSAAGWYAWAEGLGAHRLPELRRYLDTIYRFAPQVGLAAHVLVCQSVHECTDPETGVPWASEAWSETLNPAGIGVTRDELRTWHDFARGDWAALAHLVRVSQYALGTVPTTLWEYQYLDPRGAVPAAIRGQRRTLESFGHPDWRNHPTWATDGTYGEKWARTLNRLASVYTATQPAGDGTGGAIPGGTTMKAHQAVGLSRPLYLPDDIVFETKIIPSNRTYVRSNTKRASSDVTSVTRHETYNFATGADAEMHYRWLLSNVGNNRANAAGYNTVSDDRKIIHMTPYDEDTWAGGTYVSNHTSDHHELCVNAGINHTKARRIAAALDAAVIHARGLTVAGALKQHNYWTGKNCPYLLRRDGLWPSYVNMVASFYAQIVAHLNGDAGPVEIGKGDAVTTTARLNVREGFGTGYPVLVTLDAGAAATIVNGPQTSDGYTWWQVEAGEHTGWVAQDWLQVTEKAAEPETGWPYPEPIVPAWWEDLTTGKKPYIEDAGMRWYRTNVLYRVTKATKRQQLAVGDDRVVGPTLEPGTTFRGAASGQSAIDTKSYTITPGLTRVDLDALEVVEEADEAAPDAA